MFNDDIKEHATFKLPKVGTSTGDVSQNIFIICPVEPIMSGDIKAIWETHEGCVVKLLHQAI